MDRHFNKLYSTLSKLQQIPLPDREPTPKPAPPLPDGETHPRITLRVADRLGNSRTPFGSYAGRRRRGATFGTGRSARRTIRRDDDWEDLPDAERNLKRRGRRPGVGFQPKPLPPPPLTESGEPVDPLTLPWNRLMPYELARLRKRMKKNTQWTPSTTMILRELESLGRGIANKYKYTHQVESGEFPHCSPEEGGIGSLATESSLSTTENRGMKLNAAKRRLKEAQALAAVKAQQNSENFANQYAKMEDSVVVGPSKPINPGKATIAAGPPPTIKPDLSPLKTDTPSTSASTVQVTRGKDPDAMSKLRTTALNPEQQLNNSVVQRATSPPVECPSPLAKTPSPQPIPIAEPMLESNLSPEKPTAPPTPDEKASAHSPPSIAGHKRKRSSISSPTLPVTPPVGPSASSESTISSAAASEQPPTTRNRSSISAPSGPSSSEVPSLTPPAQQAAIVTAAPEAKRRGRPPGSFKTGASKRKHAAKLNALAKLEENAAAQKSTSAAEGSPTTASDKASGSTKKEEEGEWEDDMEVNEHEPRYCICNGFSHGMMLGCDNDEVREPISFGILLDTP